MPPRLLMLTLTGPYTCMINSDGTAATWTDITVTTTPPGRNSRNRVSLPFPITQHHHLTSHRTASRATSPWWLPSPRTSSALVPWPVRKTCAWFAARTTPTPDLSAESSPCRWPTRRRPPRLAGCWPARLLRSTSSCSSCGLSEGKAGDKDDNTVRRDRTGVRDLETW
jgi:hypothetical protein